MKAKTRTARRSATAAVLLAGGGALATAAWAGGDHGLAVGLVVFYVVAAAIAFLWAGGKGDLAAIMRVDGDERQRGIDRDALVVAAYAMSGAALVGAIVETARDLDPGAYGVMCLVGAVAYCASLIYLRRAR